MKTNYLPILQLDPAHPSSHVHVLGEEHTLLVPHDGLQYAVKNLLISFYCESRTKYLIDSS